MKNTMRSVLIQYIIAFRPLVEASKALEPQPSEAEIAEAVRRATAYFLEEAGVKQDSP